MEKLKLIKDVKTLIKARESHKRRINSMLHVIDNKNLSVSFFKAYEPIINEWLSEINKLNIKIEDSSCKLLVAERTLYVWRINYFDRWSRHIFSPNRDDESHSARMTFPGKSNSVKARQTTSS